MLCLEMAVETGERWALLVSLALLQTAGTKEMGSLGTREMSTAQTSALHAEVTNQEWRGAGMDTRARARCLILPNLG